ncbi:MAG: PfkB family carbohydrate kinase [Puniceicoccales bacterium]|jgi:sugar/nucleoside kinase (ribokinase family)|nr:PfkB family carbohydrate kinase [Puniceicoccales bacterium]
MNNGFFFLKYAEARPPAVQPSPMSVLVSGTVAYDDIAAPGGSGENLLGGSASYAAIAAALFAPTHLAGIVGDDFAERDRERLRRRGVDLGSLATVTGGETFRWRGRYHEDFNSRDTLETRLGVNALPRPPLSAEARRAPFVLLANDAPGLQLDVRAQLLAPRFVVADSMNLWIETARDDLLRVVQRTSLLVLNDSEARQFTGEQNLITAGRRLLELGPVAVIIKKGEHGALLFHYKGGLFALPAYPVEDVLDPTGAGDSFAGALTGVLAALKRTDFTALRLAMLYATAVASVTVESLSCDRLEITTPKEIEDRAERLRSITTIS